jgi:hypothetical protein
MTDRKSKRGNWTPRKADVDAYREGRLTVNARRLERAVNEAFEAHRIYLRARKIYKRKLELLYTRLQPEGGGLRASSVDGSRQVTWSQRRIVKGNANAEKANGLIQEVAAGLLGSKAASDDERTLASFLQGVIQRSKGRIIMNANLVAFRRLKFSDARLVQAQRLLHDAFDVKEGRIYASFEVFESERGRFVKADWNEQEKKWQAV